MHLFWKAVSEANSHGSPLNFLFMLVYVPFYCSFFPLALSTCPLSAASLPGYLCGIYSQGSHLHAAFIPSHEINFFPPIARGSFCCFCSRLNLSFLNVGDENYTCCYRGLTPALSPAQISYLAHFGVKIVIFF